MKKVFRTSTPLQKNMELVCTKAVENTCNRLLDTLQELIYSEYYDQFEPDFYIRTYDFWKSAIIKMLNLNCGEIFMDKTVMNYSSYWNGESQLQFASRGYHGTTEIQTKGRFWQSFVDYCEQNALTILKDELRKQGLNVT